LSLVQPADRPFIHLLLYGDSGAGKSTGAATFPTPQLVFSFDPVGKELPYLRRAGSRIDGETDDGTPYSEILSTKTGESLVRVEHYIDSDPQQPEAYTRFLLRLAEMDAEMRSTYEALRALGSPGAIPHQLIAPAWKTLVIDSVTFMELAARKLAQYKLNKNAKDPRQWWGASTDTLEEVLMFRFGAVRTNVVVIAHADEDKDDVHGFYLRNPRAPGRLRKSLPSAYNEFYRAYVRRTDEGDREYLWQTRSDNLWNAATQVGAPEPCVPHFSAIWTS